MPKSIYQAIVTTNLKFINLVFLGSIIAFSIYIFTFCWNVKFSKSMVYSSDWFSRSSFNFCWARVFLLRTFYMKSDFTAECILLPLPSSSPLLSVNSSLILPRGGFPIANSVLGSRARTDEDDAIIPCDRLLLEGIGWSGLSLPGESVREDILSILPAEADLFENYYLRSWAWALCRTPRSPRFISSAFFRFFLWLSSSGVLSLLSMLTSDIES